MRTLMVAVAFVCGLSFFAHGDDGGVTFFQFQTLGDDCYEDDGGTTMLMEGECYALVWRHNDFTNSIQGLFTDKGEPVDTNKCEILGICNTAVQGVLEDDGHWYASATNSVIFLPDGHYEQHSTKGVYSVFVFDTRIKDGDQWRLGGKTSDKTVASLRRYGLVTDLENITLGTGAGGTFCRCSEPLLPYYIYPGESADQHTSTGDNGFDYGESHFYSCADTPVVCRVSFYVDEETLSEWRTVEIGQPIGELPTPAAREGFFFAGWFTTGGEPVTPQTIVTSGMKLMAKWEAVREPVFSSVSIANGKAVLSVTNTMPSLSYDISWVTSVVEVFSKTNWVNDVKQGQEEALSPLTWTIDLLGEPQGFFRVLRK